MLSLFYGLLLLAAPPEAAPVVAADVVVVCAPEFRPALAPWEVYRRSQGAKLRFTSPQPSEGLLLTLRGLAKESPPTHVVLVGDVDAADPATGRPAGIPAMRIPARVNVLFGSEPQIGTDMPYVDFDEDGIPDAALGRIPIDNPAQLLQAVEKIIAYERNSDFGPWRQRVQLVAGVGGFGAIVDGVIENTAKQFLCHGIPAGYSTNMIYGSWRSPYCPDPRQFQSTVVRQFNAGSLFWVYIGHGHPERFDRLHVPNAAYSILEKRDISQLKAEHGSPIALLLACYTGAYDYQRDCLAEELFRAPGGPVAVLAGSRVTMPYAMTVMSHELLRETFERRTPTLGQVLLNAKRNMVSTFRVSTAGDTDTSEPREWIDALGKVLSPRPELLEAERYEHLALFNLLGDPLLRIAYPQPIQLSMPDEIRGGETMQLRLESPLAGQGTLQLVCRRDGLTFSPAARDEFQETPAALRDLQDTYERANDHRWAEHAIELPAGKFEIELPVPVEAFGHCQIRVYLSSGEGHALGGGDVYVRKASAAATR